MSADGDSVSPVSPQENHTEKTPEQDKPESKPEGKTAEQQIKSGAQKAKESMQKSFGSPAMQKACQWLAFAAAIVMTVGQASNDFWYYGNSAGSIFRFLFYLFVTVLVCLAPFHLGKIEEFSQKYMGFTVRPLGQGAVLFLMSCYIYPWFHNSMSSYEIVTSVFGLAALVLSALVFLCGFFGGK